MDHVSYMALHAAMVYWAINDILHELVCFRWTLTKTLATSALSATIVSVAFFRETETCCACPDFFLATGMTISYGMLVTSCWRLACRGIRAYTIVMNFCAIW